MSLSASNAFRHIIRFHEADVMKRSKPLTFLTTAFALILHFSAAQAEVLAEAIPEIRIPLAKAPTSRPMTIAHVPHLKRYSIADGGLAAPPGDPMGARSPSEVHVYDESGNYLSSAKPGLDNRSIYYNTNTQRLETVTYNVSSEAGMSPGTGIFSLPLNEDGSLVNDSHEISGHNPAFGSAGTMPSYDADRNLYYAKQNRSNLVHIVDPAKREAVGQIRLDLDAAGTDPDGISHYFVAYTGVQGEELALLDVDRKAVLVFDLHGKFIGRSALPASLKLRSQNHINGTGYCNGMFFVFAENEGEHGTYHGFRIQKQ
jgi:hypothetical protein